MLSYGKRKRLSVMKRETDEKRDTHSVAESVDVHDGDVTGGRNEGEDQLRSSDETKKKTRLTWER